MVIIMPTATVLSFHNTNKMVIFLKLNIAIRTAEIMGKLHLQSGKSYSQINDFLLLCKDIFCFNGNVMFEKISPSCLYHTIYIWMFLIKTNASLFIFTHVILRLFF